MAKTKSWPTPRQDLASEGFFSALMESVNDMVWCASLDDFKLTYINPAAEIIYDRSTAELFEDPMLWRSAIHPDDQPKFENSLVNALSQKQFELEYRVIQPSGAIRWMEGRMTIVYDKNGTASAIGGIGKDVTKHVEGRLELEESKAVYHSLVESLPIKVFCKDLEGRIVFGNKQYCDSLGKPLEDLVGLTDYDLFSEELAEKYVNDDKGIIESGEALQAIEEHRLPDGELIYVEVLKSPVVDPTGVTVGIQGMFWDVSERMRAENAVREAKEMAEAASRAKSDFLANMSHEIRTPMNAILGMSELLMESELDNTQHEYLKIVQQSGQSLLDLINDILDFSKVEAGKLELDESRFEIRELLGNSLKALAVRAHDKNLELAFQVDESVPKTVLGDQGRLRQIVVNLVNNAIKFTESGEVVLQVSSLGEQNGITHLKFAVTDTGIGIPQEKLKTVFEEFEQADTSTTRVYGGTGLGLAIASKLVRLMQGRIWVESSLGQGSIFFFTAKLAMAPDFENPTQDRFNAIVDIPVLVVDDNATNRRFMHEVLKNWGMKPHLACDANDAKRLLIAARDSEFPFQMVLTDLNMPEVDGFMLSEWLRERDEFKTLPIIMLTSSTRPGEQERRKTLGIKTQILKPVKQSELFNAIMQEIGEETPAEVEEPSCDTAAPSTHEPRPLKILLAEDNKVNQTLALGILAKHHHQVTVVETGVAAVQACVAEPYDVILMDVQMPEMDGIEATQKIRINERQTDTHIPIIAMTAHAMQGDRQRCLDAGMDQYLSKPIRIKQLTEALEAIGATLGNRADQANCLVKGELVNWNEAMKTVDNDSFLLCEVVKVFLEDQKRLLNELKLAIRTADAVKMQREAHSLKGALLHLGASRPMDVAFEIEKQGAKGKFFGVDELYLSLETLLDQLKLELVDFVNRTERD